MPPDEETPRRRTEDHLVSYKDMVEFVAKTETDLHSIRAEGFLSINREMERSEARIGTHIKEVRENLIQKIDGLSKDIRDLKEDFMGHEEWHRNMLQGIIDKGSQNRYSMATVIIAVLAIIISTTVGVIALTQR
jgi:phage host-nuclease inhibitor protein Gam